MEARVDLVGGEDREDLEDSDTSSLDDSSELYECQYIEGTLLQAIEWMTEEDIFDLEQLGFGQLPSDLLNILLRHALSIGVWHLAIDQPQLPVETAIRLVDILLEAGADINNTLPDLSKNGYGDMESAICNAARSGNVRLLRHVIQKGSRFDPEESSYVFSAIPHLECVKFLVEECGAVIPNNDKCLAEHLFMTLSKDTVGITKLLQRKGLDLRQLTQYSQTCSTWHRRHWRSLQVFERMPSLENSQQLSDDISKFFSDMALARAFLQFFLPLGYCIPSAEDVTLLARRGSFLTLAILSLEVANFGRSLQFPYNLTNHFFDLPLLKYGAGILSKVIGRSPAMANSSRGFLRKLDQIVNGYRLADRSAIPTLLDLAAEALRNQIASRGWGLKNTLEQLPIPPGLIAYIIMEDIVERMECDLRQLYL